MQRFTSEWRFEPVHRAGVLDWNRPRSGERTGARCCPPVRAACPLPPALADAPELALIERERDVLRRPAARDRPA